MRKLLTIGEVADLLKLSAHTIRYYEKEGLVKPSHMTETGYRLFDYEDILLIGSLMTLRDSEIPIKDIRTLIGEYKKSNHKILLEKSKEKVQKEILRLQNLEADITQNIQRLSSEGFDLNKIVQKKFNKRYFYEVISSDYEMRYSIKELYELYKKMGIATDQLYKAPLHYILEENKIIYGIISDEKKAHQNESLFLDGTYLTYKFTATSDLKINEHIRRLLWHISQENLTYDSELLLIANNYSIVNEESPPLYELQIKVTASLHQVQPDEID